MILDSIAEARAAGARLQACCELIGIDVRTIQRWQKRGPNGGKDRRAGPTTRPHNKLSEQERAKVIEIVTSPEFRDLSPKQIVPILAERGVYVASESTIQRILREDRLSKHRGKKKIHQRPARSRLILRQGPTRFGLGTSPTSVARFAVRFTICIYSSTSGVGRSWAGELKTVKTASSRRRPLSRYAKNKISTPEKLSCIRTTEVL